MPGSKGSLLMIYGINWREDVERASRTARTAPPGAGDSSPRDNDGQETCMLLFRDETGLALLATIPSAVSHPTCVSLSTRWHLRSRVPSDGQSSTPPRFPNYPLPPGVSLWLPRNWRNLSGLTSSTQSDSMDSILKTHVLGGWCSLRT
jgi:hypothetical protein